MPTQLLLTAGIALISWIVLLRVVTGGERIDLADLFRHPGELRWPRGVQEEEPQPWRLELLERRDRRPAPSSVTNHATRPAPIGEPKGVLQQDRAA